MKTTITVGITAKNEARGIESSLRSLLTSIRHAENQLPLQFDPVVILDDCTDQTESIVQSMGVRIIHSSGGIVEAQRKVANHPPFVIFSDADIFVEEATITELTRAMLDEPGLQVAYSSKSPLAPVRQTLLAQALYCYNRVNGFQTARRYFNGKLFAIRDWRVPGLRDLESRMESLPRDRFYNFHAGMRIDDIYLSRDILHRYGPGAIREISGAMIRFRPPETYRGMYRTYRRMRLEIERLNFLFPEAIPVHQSRGYDREAVRRGPLKDRMFWRLFRCALAVCRMHYAAEKFYYQHLASSDCPAWSPVHESKSPICSDTGLPASSR